MRASSSASASGTRVPHAKFRRLEGAGLVVRDTGRPVHAGQPVFLAGVGRVALFRRPPGPYGADAEVPCSLTNLGVHSAKRHTIPSERLLLSPTNPEPV